MSSAQATETPGSPPNLQAPGQGGIKEWFWRGQALAAAKAAPKASSLRRERLRRARLAAELGDRTIDPAEPLRDGSALPLAITLFREAAYWALLSHSDAEGSPSTQELLDGGKYPKPALSDADVALLRKTLVDKSFVETAEDRADVLCKEADLAQAFVHGLIQSELDAEDKVTNVLVQRWVRVGILAALIGAVLFSLAGVARGPGPGSRGGQALEGEQQSLRVSPERHGVRWRPQCDVLPHAGRGEAVGRDRSRRPHGVLAHRGDQPRGLLS
jgi:hypothetical protein